MFCCLLTFLTIKMFFFYIDLLFYKINDQTCLVPWDYYTVIKILIKNRLCIKYAI